MRAWLTYVVVSAVAMVSLVVIDVSQARRIGALEGRLATVTRTIAAVDERAQVTPSELQRREAEYQRSKSIAADIVYNAERATGIRRAPSAPSESR